MKRHLLLPLAILTGSISTLHAQSFFTGTPQYLTPGFRTASPNPASNTEYSYWDIFYNPNLGANYPDMQAPNGFGSNASDVGVTPPPGSTFNPYAFWNSANPTLTQTNAGAAIIASAGANGNIYGLGGNTAFQVLDTVPYAAGLGTVNLQWQTDGSLLDFNSLRLVYTTAGGVTVSLPADNFITEYQAYEIEYGISLRNRASAQWDLRGKNITSYKIVFVSSGSSSSLQELVLDTSATYQEVTPTTRVWSAGGGASLLWSNTANWTGDTLPTSAGNVTISVGNGITVDGSQRVISELKLNTPGNYTISNSSGGSLKINTGITANPAAPATPAVPPSGNDPGTPAVPVQYTISSPISMGSFNLIDVNENAELTLSGVISGSVGLIRFGEGLLNLTANNTFAGRLVIEGGITKISGSNSYTGGTTVSVGTLLVQANSPAASAGALGNGTGNPVVIGSGGSYDAPRASLLIDGAYTVAKPFRTTEGSDPKTIGGQNTGAGAVYSGSITMEPGSSNLSFHAAEASDRVTFSGAITGGTGIVYKTGAGTVVFSGGSKSYNTATTISAGTLEVASGLNFTSPGPVTVSAGATLRVHGSLSGAGTLALEGGTLGGSGTVNRAFTLEGGDTLSPGDAIGIGTINTVGETWGEGGRLRLELADGLGIAGTGWDFVNIAGILNLAATSGGKFILELDTLASGVAGHMANFNTDLNFTWKIATASGGITGFNASLFSFDLAGFENSPQGYFSVTNTGNDLFLNYTAVPEPSAALYLLSGSALLLRRRRRQS